MSTQQVTVGQLQVVISAQIDGYRRQMQDAQNETRRFTNRVSSMMGSIKRTIVGAFAVGAITSFGKSCINLGSDLAEVQNVVDVVFSSMSDAIDDFAKNAANTFGLSETMAKKFAGTFGAMASSFGFTEQEAYNMATTLTGLAGDVASFYNISQDEAYIKLKSVFSGETETLKDLGIVMTENALNSYAQAQGINATVSAMSEQEKVALRYQFVLEQLTFANGDFARTSNSWANQVRILSLQFDSLRATLGQGLINVFLPVIKVLNIVIQKLQIVAGWFKTVTEMIFGKAKDTQVVAPIVSATDSTDNLSNSLKNVGNNAGNASKKASKGNDNISKSAKKAKKEIAGLIGGLDEINNLNVNKTSGTNPTKTPSTGGLGASAGLGGLGNSLLSDINNDLSKTNDEISALQKKLVKMKDLFLKGFNKAFKNNFKQIQKHCKNIKKSLKDIFGDSKVQNASKRFYESLVYNLGRISGSIVDIGVTLAENLLGGLDKYLKENKDRLKEHLIRLFDIGTEINNICGDFGEAVANIFRVFRSDEAKEITANIIGIFTEAKLGVLEVVGTLGKDVLDIITLPIVENQDKIKQVLKGLFSPINTILKGMEDNLKHAFDTFWKVYDEYIKPGVDNIKSGLSELLNFVLDVFIADILPGLDGFAEAWVKCFGPKCEEMLSNILEGLGRTFYGITEAFKGVIEIITGIGKGDWSKAWQGLVDVAKGIWDTLGGVLKIFGIELPKSSEVASSIKSWWKKTTDAVGEVIFKIGTTIESIYEKIKKAYSVANDWLDKKRLEAKTAVESIYEKAKNTFDKAKAWLDKKRLEAQTKIESIYSKVQNSYDSAKKWLKSKALQIKINVTSAVGSVKNMVNKLIDTINSKVIAKLDFSVKAPSWLGGGTFGWKAPRIPKLAKGGLVNSPTIAMIGEAGKEVVLPLENNAQALDLIANKLASKIGYSNSSVFSSSKEQTMQEIYNGDIVIKLDGNTVFREKIIDILRQLKRQGIPVL